jgi:aminobenzoyl-glutamate transport protein
LRLLRKYEPNAGLGTLISRLLPFTAAFWASWLIILAAFHFLGLPFDPGQYSRY